MKNGVESNHYPENVTTNGFARCSLAASKHIGKDPTLNVRIPLADASPAVTSPSLDPSKVGTKLADIVRAEIWPVVVSGGLSHLLVNPRRHDPPQLAPGSWALT